jgi:hypothetical protein
MKHFVDILVQYCNYSKSILDEGIPNYFMRQRILKEEKSNSKIDDPHGQSQLLLVRDFFTEDMNIILDM